MRGAARCTLHAGAGAASPCRYYPSSCHAYCNDPEQPPVACTRIAQCFPVADVVFLLDTSTSIEDPELGGSAGAFAAMTAYAASVVDGFSTSIGVDRVRVAALTFATAAQVQFNFIGESARAPDLSLRTAESVRAALLGIKYDASSRRSLSDTNIHLALRTMRTQLLAASGSDVTGFRQQAVPLHIVLVTDGKASSAAHDAVALLVEELRGSTCARMNVNRWVAEVGSGDASTVMLLASSAAQVGRVSDARTATVFVGTVSKEDEVCESSTPITDCMVDVIFLVDVSAADDTRYSSREQVPG